MISVRFGIAAMAACLLAVAPVRGDAQSIESTKEFGFDAGDQVGLSGGSYTSFNLPAQRLRVGFFRSPRVSVEPYGSLNYNKFSGRDGVTTIGFGTGMLYHLTQNRAASQAYVRPFAEVNYINSPTSRTQFQLGGGLGIKVPWRERISTRFEAAMGYDFKGSATILNLTAGLSFFTLP